MPVPVLLIIFNRPELTRKVLEALSIVKPPILFVAADGPRFPEEAGKCMSARDAIQDVDWACEIRRDYSDKNLGCGVRVHSAIQWAFSQCDELIVLEDDCIPAPSFFSFCEQILSYYRHDERIMHIGSFNFQDKKSIDEYSYFFSKYPIASGAWATWRRAWKSFDPKIASWPELKAAGLVKRWCDDPDERSYWTDIFDRMYEGAPDVWDYQWNFACWAQGGLSILPRVPLATNIGFGADATHTKAVIASLTVAPGEIGDVVHRPSVIRNYEADKHIYEYSFGGHARRKANSPAAKIADVLRFFALPWRAIRKVWRLIAQSRSQS